MIGAVHDAEALVVKELTRQATATAGGQKLLAPLIRQQRVSDLGNDQKVDVVRITEAALFDRLTHGKPGGAHFARFLADNVGCALIALPAVGQPETLWSQQVGSVLKEVGDIVTGVGFALQDNNDVDPAEAKALLPEIEEAVNKVVQLREMLKRRAEGMF